MCGERDPFAAMVFKWPRLAIKLDAYRTPAYLVRAWYAEWCSSMERSDHTTQTNRTLGLNSSLAQYGTHCLV